MAKEKKRNIEELERKETLFYFEMLGVILIIFSLVTLGKLGKIGKILTIATKVLFGDWYWMLLLFILFLGIYNLFVHKKFDFKNQKFIGFLFIYIVIIIFSHFTIHKYLILKEGNYLKNTWIIYKDFLNGNSYSYLGGGLIGGGIFFIGFYLMGITGVIILGILFFVLGFSLIINKPLNEIFKFLWFRIKNIKKYTGNFNSFFKYELGKPVKQKKKITIKNFDYKDNGININKQIEELEEIKSIITSIFNNNEITIKNFNIYKGYIFSKINITTLIEVDFKKIINRLKTLIDNDIMFGYNKKNLVIHIVNKYKIIYGLREIMEKENNFNNNYIIPLGFNEENDISLLNIKHNDGLLMVGSYKKSIYEYIIYLMFVIKIKNDINNYFITIYSNDVFFKNMKEEVKIDEYSDIKNIFNSISEEIHEREKELIINKCFSFSDYEKKDSYNETNNKYKIKIIIIDFNWEDVNSNIIDKIMYCSQMTKKVGIFIILILDYAKNELIKLFKHILVFKLDTLEKSVDIFSNDKGFYLLEKNDCFYLSDSKSVRLQTPTIDNNEINLLKNKAI